MTGKTRTLLLSLTIIAVIVFSAFGTTTVYADEGPPPDTEPTETTLPDEVSAESTDTAAEGIIETTIIPEATTDTSVSADAGACSSEGADTDASGCSSDGVPAEVAGEASAPVEETTDPQPTDQATDQAAPAPVAEDAVSAPDSTVLNEVPDNTTITVIDAEGQSQPLATQESADAIATSDPIWCPGAQAPTPGANGCTDSFTSFDALLDTLAANPTVYQGAGTIYVQQGAYTGGESSIDFNAYNLSNISNADLTITGGWNTSNGTVDPTTTSDFRNTPILIGSSTNPWGGSLTLYNLSLNFTPQTSAPATPENGLTLYAQNDINLSNVNVMNAPSAGADLNAGGGVNIINSKFDRNQTTGATIRSGSVAINNSSFSNPEGGRRQDTGLDIISTGSVALLDVLANNGRRAGATIDAGGRVTISSSFFSGTKLMNGSGATATFLGYGLQVVTPDAIDLSGVTANDNFLWGASLQAGGNVAIADSIFNANTTESPGFIDDTGLLVTSGGSVALNNVQANENRLIGAVIDAVGDVAINNSTFSSNNGVTLSSTGTPTFHGYGLQVVTQGNISMALVNASDNTLFGAHLDAGGDVAISGSNFNNQTSGSATDQTGRGLEVISLGNVFLSNVVIDNNQTFGASIQAGGDISLEAVTATNNGSDGILLQGICAQVTGGTYSGNGQYGLNFVGGTALNLVSSPTFANNAAGDFFPASPAICAVLASTSGSGNTTSGAGSSNVGAGAVSNGNVFASLQIAPQQNASALSSQRSGSVSGTNFGSANVTLNSYITNIRTTAGGIELSIFTGKYTYIYSSSGLHIIAFSPSSDGIAMDGSYKAY